MARLPQPQTPRGRSVAMNINFRGGVCVFNPHIYCENSREEIHEYDDDEEVPEEQNGRGIARGEGGSRRAARGANRGRRGGRGRNPDYGRGFDVAYNDPNNGPIQVTIGPVGELNNPGEGRQRDIEEGDLSGGNESVPDTSQNDRDRILETPRPVVNAMLLENVNAFATQSSSTNSSHARNTGHSVSTPSHPQLANQPEAVQSASTSGSQSENATKTFLQSLGGAFSGFKALLGSFVGSGGSSPSNSASTPQLDSGVGNSASTNPTKTSTVLSEELPFSSESEVSSTDRKRAEKRGGYQTRSQSSPKKKSKSANQ